MRGCVKRLLTLQEFCTYVGVKETKARELLHDEDLRLAVRIGARLYADKKEVDLWIDSLHAQ